MTRLAAVSLPVALLALAAVVAPRPVRACGGFYGQEVEVAPDQSIVVIHRDGEETYVFRPRFCGTAAEFGVILPVPAPLSASPALQKPALFHDLERFTAPEVVEVCGPAGGIACGASGGAGDGGEPPDFGTGVDVVDRGRIGIFEWALLQATSAEAFTEWLGANGFPHDPADTSAYDHYVAEAWYFVAFKVTAGEGAPPPGKRLCGDLGPIRLSFPAPRPVVPARITGVNADSSLPTWRIFVVAGAQQRLGPVSGFRRSLHFAGTLRQADLGELRALAAVAEDGERLTVLDVGFPPTGAGEDIVLEEDLVPRDHRSLRFVSKDCGGGCEAGGAPTLLAAFAAALLLLRNPVRGSRRRRPG